MRGQGLTRAPNSPQFTPMDNKHLVDVLTLEGFAPPAKGRRAAPVHMHHERDLTAADWELVINPPAIASVPVPIKQLRATHHMAARLLAEGKRSGDVSLITGYSLTRLSILKQDPAFKELTAYYASNVNAQYASVHERLATLGTAMLDELQERLDEKPEDFTNREVMDAAEMLLDRSGQVSSTGPGAGPLGRGINISVNFVPSAQSDSQIIEVTPSTKPPDNRGPSAGNSMLQSLALDAEVEGD